MIRVMLLETPNYTWKVKYLHNTDTLPEEDPSGKGGQYLEVIAVRRVLVRVDLQLPRLGHTASLPHIPCGSKNKNYPEDKLSPTGEQFNNDYIQ